MTSLLGSGTGAVLGHVAVGFVVSVALLVLLDRGRHDHHEPRSGRRERLDPPVGVSVLVVGHVLRRRERSVLAQLVALARRGTLRADRTTAGWTVEVLDPTGLGATERAFVEALVRGDVRRGARGVLRREDGLLAARIRAVQALVNTEVVRQGYRRVTPLPWQRWPVRAALLALTWSASRAGGDPAVTAFAVLALLVLTALAWTSPRHRWHTLTEAGHALRQHVRDVEETVSPGRLQPLLAEDRSELPDDLGDLLPLALLLGIEPWLRGRILAEDSWVEELVADLGPLRDHRGHVSALAGDAWERQSTGGSGALHDGAPGSDV